MPESQQIPTSGPIMTNKVLASSPKWLFHTQSTSFPRQRTLPKKQVSVWSRSIGPSAWLSSTTSTPSMPSIMDPHGPSVWSQSIGPTACLSWPTSIFQYPSAYLLPNTKDERTNPDPQTTKELNLILSSYPEP